MPFTLNPFSPEFQADPYPTYHLLRSEDPVHYAEVMGFGFWVLTRYSDVAALLRDPRLSAQAVAHSLLPRELCDGNIFFKDPPEHTRLRNLINKAFVPQTVEGLRPRIVALVDRLIDQALAREKERGNFDVVHDLGVPLSLGMICEILGLPYADQPQIKRWSEDLSVLLDGTRLLSGMGAAKAAAIEIVAYFRAALNERQQKMNREAPPADLLCALLLARDNEDQLSEEELIATAVFTLLAGHETVTKLIGSGLLALYQHPAEWLRLRNDPNLAASAFEEMLRYDPPGQLTTKVAKEDIEIGGKQIKSGQPVVLVLAAANRDPAQFPDPDRFDIGRKESRHMAFSLGPHYCVGAPLARMQGQLLLLGLINRMPELTIDPQKAVRKPGVVLRGLDSLPAHSTPRRELGAAAA